jgi:hypothetical protein
MGIKTYKQYQEKELNTKKKKYVITGTDRNGKRFKPIKTNTPQHYNIYEGSLWELKENGKRKLIKRYYN